MNFEQLRLQIHMRGLYERLGTMDAELLIVEAFRKEMERNERLEEQQALERENKLAQRSTAERHDHNEKFDN